MSARFKLPKYCRREAAGRSQTELARRAGVRTETLCRLEPGNVSPLLATVHKPDRALRAAEGAPGPKPPKRIVRRRA